MQKGSRDHRPDRASDLDARRKLYGTVVGELDVDDALPAHLGPLLADERDLRGARHDAVPDGEGPERAAAGACRRVLRNVEGEHPAVEAVGTDHASNERTQPPRPAVHI